MKDIREEVEEPCDRSQFTGVKGEIPLFTGLLQVTPNPFNEKCTIKYSIKEACEVQLKIFNAVGEIVKIYSKNINTAGEHSIEFKADSNPQGIYFFKLQMGDIVNYGKLMLVR